MPGGPLAHICFLVSDLDKAIEDWTKILTVMDPDQLVEPIVRYDQFEAGDDVMAWATFSNPKGTEIQLLAPLNADGPLGKRLAKHGEGVHHVAFLQPELKHAVEELDRPRVSAHLARSCRRTRCCRGSGGPSSRRRARTDAWSRSRTPTSRSTASGRRGTKATRSSRSRVRAELTAGSSGRSECSFYRDEGSGPGRLARARRDGDG